MIKFLKKYKEQIFNIITIFLILEFAIYPGLTTADTFYNILAGIGLLLLIVWGGLSLYNYVRSGEGGLVDKAELDEAQKMYDAKTKEMLESELGPVIDEMAKEVLAKPKKKATTKPKVQPKVESKKEKVMGEYQLNNKEKVRKSLTKTRTK
jgi:hypothetical protein